MLVLANKPRAAVLEVGYQNRRAAQATFGVQGLKGGNVHGFLVASAEPFDENLDAAAAGKTDPPRSLVGDAELQHLRLAGIDHVDRLGDDRALDATAGNRAMEIAFGVDDQMAADWTRRRPPGLDHGCKRNVTAFVPPGFRNDQRIPDVIEVSCVFHDSFSLAILGSLRTKPQARIDIA